MFEILHILRRSIYVVLEVNFRIPDKTGIWCPNCCAMRCLVVHRAESCPYNLLLLYLFSLSLAEETEYEYSGSDEEDENRGDERESRYKTTADTAKAKLYTTVQLKPLHSFS